MPVALSSAPGCRLIRRGLVQPNAERRHGRIAGVAFRDIGAVAARRQRRAAHRKPGLGQEGFREMARHLIGAAADGDVIRFGKGACEVVSRTSVAGCAGWNAEGRGVSQRREK